MNTSLSQTRQCVLDACYHPSERVFAFQLILTEYRPSINQPMFDSGSTNGHLLYVVFSALLTSLQLGVVQYCSYRGAIKI